MAGFLAEDSGVGPRNHTNPKSGKSFNLAELFEGVKCLWIRGTSRCNLFSFAKRFQQGPTRNTIKIKNMGHHGGSFVMDGSLALETGTKDANERMVLQVEKIVCVGGDRSPKMGLRSLSI